MSDAASDPLSLYRPIPKSGESIPPVGLGTWQVFDIAGDAGAKSEAARALKRFAELGGKLIDSSPMYGSAESVVGELVQRLGLQPFLATKVWTHGREAGIREMEESMRRLRLAPSRPLDLMQVHNLMDIRTHWPVLCEWKAAGRIRYLGITHYHESAYGDLERWLRTAKPDFIQLNYSLAEQSAEQRLLPLAADTGTAVIINRPFAEGAMFRRVRGKPLPDWAADWGIASWAQFFLKWILAHSAVTCVIPGTRNARHVEDDLAAARGPLPDAATRRTMADYFDTLAM